MENSNNTKQRKQRSDKGMPRDCRWTDGGYHSLRLRLSDDLYDLIVENKGERSINQYINDLIRDAIGSL